MDSGSQVAGARELARTVAEAYRAFDFDRPLPSADPRWQDLSEARGDRAAELLRKRFFYKEAEKPIHLIFCSHRGAGKTTELNRLCHALSDRYHSVYFQTNVELDPFTVEAEDLILALAQIVESDMRKNEMPLPKDLLESVSKWFDEVIKSTSWGKEYSAEVAAGVRGGAEIPFFVKLFASLKSLCKVESHHRTEVRSMLRRYPGTLMTHINGLLEEANRILKAKDKELLIVIDNLDRYDRRVVDDLLVRGGDRIRSLSCNLVLTPPISLLYQTETDPISSIFDWQVMNTVRLRRKDQGYREFDGPGRDLMLAALGKRVDMDTLVPDSTVRDRLVAASGGSMRDLLELAREVALLSDHETLDSQAMEEAVKRRVRLFRDRINANNWLEALARIARSKQISGDPRELDILFDRMAFQYNDKGWYDIHPLVSEVPGFQSALKKWLTISR